MSSIIDFQEAKLSKVIQDKLDATDWDLVSRYKEFEEMYKQAVEYSDSLKATGTNNE